jgi:hypothetical protein
MGVVSELGPWAMAGEASDNAAADTMAKNEAVLI